MRAGSIPDQIYAVVTEKAKDELRKDLQQDFRKKVEEILKGLVEGLKVKEKGEKKTEILEKSILQASEYFYLFYIFHEIDGEYPTYKEFLEAEQKILMRGRLRPFGATEEKGPNGYLQKWNRCDLCGDRDMVYKVDHESEGAQYKKERLCGICLLKRFLRDSKELADIARKPDYDSTSDIAGSPMMNAVITLRQFPSLKSSADEFFDALEKAKDAAGDKIDRQVLDNADPGDAVFGRLFFGEEGSEVRSQFRKIEEDKVKLDASYRKTTWLSRPYYAVVYMDGDNMGNAFRGNDEYFRQISDAVSQTLSIFTRRAEDIVDSHHGQLIYAGGDDVNFMIHPEYLLDSLRDLTAEYKELFRRRVEEMPASIPQEVKNKLLSLSLSAGAVVCQHKYPLSEAIKKSYETLAHRAKCIKGKDATAIHLIKGHTEALTFVIPNRLLHNIEEMIGKFEHGEISRTTPHRFGEEKALLEMLLKEDPEALPRYLANMLKATRGKESQVDVEQTVHEMLRFGEIADISGRDRIENILSVLLYIRFLTGDRENA